MAKKQEVIDENKFKEKQLRDNLLLKLKDADIILLGTDRLKIFGVVSYATRKVIVSGNECPDIAKCDTCGCWTDGKRIYFAPFGDITLGEVLALIIHEVMHIVSGHISRIGDHNPMLWNIAADHVVNSVILNIQHNNSKVCFPEGKYVHFPELEVTHPGASVEEIYNHLMQNSKTGGSGTITISLSGGRSGNSDKSAELVKDSKGNKYIKITDKKTGKSTYVKMDTSPTEIEASSGKGKGEGEGEGGGDLGEGDTPDGETTPLNKKEMEEALNDLKQRATSVWQSGMFKGNESCPITQYFDNITKIETPWEKLLEDAIKYSCQASRKRTWMRKNPYIKNARTPGRLDKNTGVKYLLFVTDTSGSVSDECLQTFLGIIVSSYKYVGGLVSLKHDVTVHSETIFTSRPTELALREGIGTVSQRGGTSHKDAFDRIEAMYNDLELSMIVFLTDFESDVQRIMDDYQFWTTVPCVWMIVKGWGGRFNVDTDFIENHNGKVVEVKEKEGIISEY